jgi:hypothetical protein
MHKMIGMVRTLASNAARNPRIVREICMGRLEQRVDVKFLGLSLGLGASLNNHKEWKKRYGPDVP